MKVFKLSKVEMNWKVVYKSGLGILGLVVFSFVGYWISVNLLGKDQVRKLVESFGILGPLILIILKSSTLVFAPLGGNPIYVLSGLLYGFWSALGLVLVGDILGSSISFWLARKFGRGIVIKLTGGRSSNLIDKVYARIGEWRGLAAASFFGLFDYVNYVAGLTQISFKRFILIVFVIRIPINAALTSLGFFPTQTFSIKLLYGFCALVYLILVGTYWYRFYKKGRQLVGAN